MRKIGKVFVMRRITLRVMPRARQNKITEENGILRVHITAAPVDGAANAAVMKLLAEYFDVPKTQIKIVRGTASRDKIIELPE